MTETDMIEEAETGPVAAQHVAPQPVPLSVAYGSFLDPESGSGWVLATFHSPTGPFYAFMRPEFATDVARKLLKHAREADVMSSKHLHPATPADIAAVAAASKGGRP
jgi:hypothetical protein